MFQACKILIMFWYNNSHGVDIYNYNNYTYYWLINLLYDIEVCYEKDNMLYIIFIYFHQVYN